MQSGYMDSTEVILNASQMTEVIKDIGVPVHQQVSPTLYALAAYYLAGITFFGASFNSVVIFIVVTDNKLLTPMNAVLLNLAFADSGIAMLGNPVAFYNALSGDWMFSRKICIFYGFMMSLCGICSIFTLSVLAYQRYHIICHPLSMASHLSWPEAKLCIIGTWLCSFLVSSPPLFGWGSYENEAANISCSVNWESKELNATTYIMFLFLVALGLPVFVITYSYCNILRTIKYATKMQSMSNTSSVRKAETHVARMILVMVIAFFIAWGPYAIFSLLIAFSDVQLSIESTIAPSLFAKSSVCYNPVIYFFLNSQFRKSWLRRIGMRRDLEDMSHEVKNMPLSRIRVSENQRYPQLNHDDDNALVIMTTTSNFSSGDIIFIDSNITDYGKRDLKISELIPYKTLPFVRRKSKMKTHSLPNII